jgi:hypothetical protein
MYKFNKYLIDHTRGNVVSIRRNLQGFQHTADDLLVLVLEERYLALQDVVRVRCENRSGSLYFAPWRSEPLSLLNGFITEGCPDRKDERNLTPTFLADIKETCSKDWKK